MSDYLLSLAYDMTEDNQQLDIFILMECLMRKEEMEKEKEKGDQNE